MIRINVKEVLKEAEMSAQEPKPAPKITIRIGPKPQDSVAEAMKEAAIHQVKSGTKKDLLDDCWSQFNEVLIERKKLSKQIAPMVGSGATKSELKEHYQKIDRLIDDGAEIFKSIRYVEQYGKLPEPIAANVDILLMKDHRKKLVDLRCKLSKKIEIGQAKNPKKVLEWQLEFDKANAEYILVDEKIKKLEGKA
jgi:hypothetical protein